MSNVRSLYLRIAPDRFHYLKFILEGYDNLAVLSSHDMSRGVVKLRYIDDSEQEVFSLLSCLAKKIA